MNPNDKNAIKLLSTEQWKLVVTAVVTSFDVEFSRIIDNAKRDIVLKHFTSLYYSVDYSSFFVAVSMNETSILFFQNDVLRRFILNLSERVCLELTNSDITQNDLLTNTLTTAITKGKPNPEKNFSLMNKEIVESLYLNPDTLKKALDDNMWLCVLYITLMYYQQTTVYQAMISTEK